jgi:hypothetical protein
MTLQSAAETVVKVAERLGVTVVFLAAVLWMLREAATSLNKNVVVPIVQSHTEFLDSTRETLDEIGKTQMKQAETLQEIAVGQTEIRHAVLSQDKEKK